MRPVGSKYLLEEPLGRGATGTVWRAQVRRAPSPGEEAVPSQPGETVAIKVLKEELASDPDIVMRFLRERSVLLRLTHPNIVRVRDLVVEGDLLALVMDLVDGPDLHRYLRENGRFSPAEAARLTAGIADALAASHADDVVHRDLKPANVLLATVQTPSGPQTQPMLTDFGIARLADSPGITRTHEFVGTPAYVAPESAEGRPQTSAVDVYGAGILLYELVTGRPPFRGDSALEVLHAHLRQDPERPRTVPEPLWTVIERCLRKNPDERPGARDLARALRVVADGVGVHATPAQAEAAFGVAAQLGPDLSPAPAGGSGDADPTQVLPSAARQGAHDPAAATSVLPATGPAAGRGGGADGPEGTRVMPPVPGGPAQPQAPQGPQGPHPWESQLDAARSRNEQTEVQYLDPGQDPLRRRPHRQAPPDAYHREPEPAPHREPEPRRRAPERSPAPYAPDREPPQRREPPRRPAPRPAPEPPAPRREPRQRSRTRIPGTGCLKGCFTMIVLLVVGSWLVWEFTPLQDWVAHGQSWWEATSGAVSDFWNWARDLVGAAEEVRQNVPDVPDVPTDLPDVPTDLPTGFSTP
ncbi:protein kinase [Streptomyces sp. NPDC059506]|uniref:serine/threonine-protein kinase n=1 Tax=Streptomyces sp. NPDC059506 TaxID=3347751 RepID=UPI003681D89B